MIMDDVERNFDFNNPSASIPDLVKAYKLISQLEDTYWRNYKTDQIIEIIADCAGLYLEVISKEANAAPSGDEIDLKMEVINRSSQKMVLNSYKH